jgi:DNA-binding transcriptional LysR family regulator
MIDRKENGFPWALDWNLMRTFMVIVEQGSITLAAEALGLQQPSLSNALKRLENSVDLRLIDRKPNYFRVTAAGNKLYRECVSIFESVSRFPGLMDDANGELSGHISILVTSHIVCPLFDQALQMFNQRYPEVTFQIRVEDSRTVINRILHKQSTLGICLVDVQDKKLSYQRMYRQYFGFFCGPSHPLFNKQEINLKDLQGETYVSFPTDSENGALRAVSKLRSKAKIKYKLGGVSASLHEVRRMIIAGLGIGPLPLHVTQKDVNDGNLRQVAPFDDLPSIDIYMVNHPKAHLNRAEVRFIEHLKHKIKTTRVSDRTYR